MQGPWPLSIKKCPRIFFYHLYQKVLIVPMSRCYDSLLKFILDQDAEPDRGYAIQSKSHAPSGLSISHVRRPGLSNLALGLASKALNKSAGLVYPYLSNQWSQSKVWPINSHLHFMGSSFLRSSNTSKKASLKKIKEEFKLLKNGIFCELGGGEISPWKAGLVRYTSGLAQSLSDKSRD